MTWFPIYPSQPQRSNDSGWPGIDRLPGVISLAGKSFSQFPHSLLEEFHVCKHHAGCLSLQLQASPRIWQARTHWRGSSKLSIANIHLIHREEKRKALQACRSSEQAAVSYAEPVFPLVSLISQCFTISGILGEDTASRPSPVITRSLCFPFFSLSLFAILNQWKKKKIEEGKEAAAVAFQFLIHCRLDYIQAFCYDPSGSS